MFAISYERVSDPKQVEGYGLERQAAARVALAAKRKVVLLDDESYRDFGISAFKGRHRTHGALKQILDRIGKTIQPGWELWIENIDRLSREKPRIAWNLINQIIEAGIVIVTTQNEVEYSKLTLDEQPHLMYVLWGEMQRAHNESQTKSDRIGDAWERSRKDTAKGLRKLNGICPAWLEPVYNDKGELTHFAQIEDRVTVVQRIFQLASNGIGQWTIAKTFNGEKVPTFTTPSNSSKKDQIGGWRAGYIGKILGHPAVLGSHIPKRLMDGKYVACDPIPGYYGDPIVDEATYLKAQQCRTAKDTTGPEVRARRGKAHVNLLNRRCFCEDCREPMAYKAQSAKKGGTRGYLTCSNHLVDKGCDNNRMFHYSWFEETVLNHVDVIPLHELFNDNENNGELREVENAIAGLTLKMAEAKKRQDKTMKLILDADDAEEEAAFRAERRSLTAELKSFETDLAKLEQKKADAEFVLKNRSHAQSAIKRLKEEMESATPTDRLVIRNKLSALLKAVIDQVWFDGKNGHITVTLLQGLINYRFSVSPPGSAPKKNPMKLIKVIDLRDQIGDPTQGLIRREVFTSGTDGVEDADRRSAFNKLMN